MKLKYSVLQLLACSIAITTSNASYTWESKLSTVLLTDYKASIRPAQKTGWPLQVEFQIELIRIRSYSLKDQVITLTAFVMMKWKDVQLAWDSSDYNGTDRINFDSSEIWTPDIVLYNTAYSERESWTDTYPSKAIILPSGEVIWNMPVIWYATCQSDITWFPLDQQNCSLDFGSWSYSNSQLELVPWKNNSTQPSIVPNGEWKINETQKTYLNVSFTCCLPFSMMRFTIVLNHLYNFYFIYIILPVISLCLMFLLIFFIPHEERLSFGITVILSITVYLLVISEKLPEKSDVIPMIGVIFTGEIFVLCFGIVITAVSVTLVKRKDTPPSKFWCCFIGMRNTKVDNERSSFLEMSGKSYGATAETSDDDPKIELIGRKQERETKSKSRMVSYCSQNRLGRVYIYIINAIYISSMCYCIAR